MRVGARPTPPQGCFARFHLYYEKAIVKRHEQTGPESPFRPFFYSQPVGLARMPVSRRSPGKLISAGSRRCGFGYVRRALPHLGPPSGAVGRKKLLDSSFPGAARGHTIKISQWRTGFIA